MKKLLVAAALVLTAASVPTIAAQAGAGSPHQITFQKVLVGGGDPTTEYELVAFCVETNGGETRDESAFVTASEPETIGLGNEAQTCTISEPDTLGAQVSFSCSGEKGDAVCVSDNVVEFTGDGVPDGEGEVTFTVTNTFGQVTPTDPPPVTDPSSTVATDTAAAATTRPSFTG
jgi:hypothetical protein